VTSYIRSENTSAICLLWIDVGRGIIYNYIAAYKIEALVCMFSALLGV